METCAGAPTSAGELLPAALDQLDPVAVRLTHISELMRGSRTNDEIQVCTQMLLIPCVRVAADDAGRVCMSGSFERQIGAREAPSRRRPADER